MRILGTSTALLCVLVPQFASAAVIINEIAWMGSGTSANDEWIELYNNGGKATVLDGWQLTDGQNLTVSLSGTLAAGAYGILERTDDTSASGPAFLIYTGALANGGVTLKLVRADGGVEDQVAGGEGWENIGGDNATKETAQYSSGGWITGTPTPGAVNTTVSIEKEVETEADTETKTSSKDNDRGGSSSAEKPPPPQYELALLIKAASRAYVNQPVALAAIPNGLSDAVIDSVTYEWNFGDTHTATGKETSHSFAYAGQYVVTVYGSFASHGTVARHTVTVLPVTMSLAVTGNGDVQVHNNARYEIDLSGYTLHGRSQFTFPDHTFLLPQATLTVPHDLLGGASIASAILVDQEGVVVAHTGASDQKNDALSGIVAGARATVSTSEVPDEVAAFSFASDELAVATDTIVVEAETKQPAEPATEAVPVAAWPYLGLIGVVSVGMVALFLRRDPGH